MAIYRGPGGSGDAVNDSSSETRLAVEARDAALAAQAAAEAAQAAAETAETNAETAETNAETAETNAETAATNAASSASSASSSASAASTSATNAASSASSASTSATNAASSASSASTSASNASTSATNAATSATTASTAATNASNSATSAASSASTATTKASEASTSATLASGYATNASNSASVASTKATEASTYATNSANSATASANSASASALSASDSNTYKLAAQAASSNATTQAANASTSAAAASSAQSAAEAARDAALSAYDNFDDRYLGPKASDPTLDNDGNALLSGALYFNTTTNVMKVYTGSAWVAAYVSAAGVLLVANNLSDLANAATARTNLGVTATGSDTTYAYRANNLSDLASASTARTNLGLGTAATTAATDYATAAQGAKADTALQPAAIGVSVQGYDADLGAIAALSGTSGLLKKTAANTWSLDTTAYLSGTVGVANGGTGLTSLTAGYIPFGNGTSAFNSSSYLTYDGTNLDNGAAASARVRISRGGTINFVNTTNTAGFDIGLLGGGTDLNVYLYQRAAGFMAFATNNTERLRIDSSGNVGIGTSSPDSKLRVDVNGGGLVSKFVSNTGSTYITVGAASTYQTQFGYNISSEYGFIQPIAAAGVYDDLVINPSGGNLGLGVTPSAWNAGGKIIEIGNAGNILFGAFNDVILSANAYYSTGWKYGGNNYASFYEQNSGQHIWKTAPSGTAGTAISFTQAMTLNASGNLLLGTTTTDQKFNLYGGNMRISNATTGATGGIVFGITGNDAFLSNQAAGYLLFGTNNTERMRIDSSGNVGIGTSSISSKVDIGGINGATNRFHIGYGANGDNYYTSGASGIHVFRTDGSERFRIGSSGQIGIGGANYGTSGQALVSNGSGSAPSWQTVSGGQYFGTAATKAIAYNSNTISENITVTAGNNGLSAGPVTVSTGFTVTVETGANWVIV